MTSRTVRSTFFPYSTLFRSGFGLLAANGCQLAETVARILLENAEGIAASDGGVLAGVAGENDAAIPDPGQNSSRSEEHTSELQSLSNILCRLPLETKNRTK